MGLFFTTTRRRLLLFILLYCIILLTIPGIYITLLPDMVLFFTTTRRLYSSTTLLLPDYPNSPTSYPARVDIHYIKVAQGWNRKFWPIFVFFENHILNTRLVNCLFHHINFPARTCCEIFRQPIFLQHTWFFGFGHYMGRGTFVAVRFPFFLFLTKVEIWSRGNSGKFLISPWSNFYFRQKWKK